MERYTEEKWKWLRNIFRDDRPDLFERVVEWFPYDWYMIGYIRDDGAYGFYDAMLDSYNLLYRPLYDEEYREALECKYSDEYVDEIYWTKHFSYRLWWMIDRTCNSKLTIAEESGVSVQTLSSYTRYRVVNPYTNKESKPAIPSLYNAVRICNAAQRPLSMLYVPNDETVDKDKILHNDDWDDMLDILYHDYPDIMDLANDWWPIEYYEEMLVELVDRRVYAFDCETYECTLIFDPNDKEFISEQEWRVEFSEVLRELLWQERISQSELARHVGVTQPMMNRYLTGKATPNLYIATKIARELNCSLTKFHII